MTLINYNILADRTCHPRGLQERREPQPAAQGHQEWQAVDCVMKSECNDELIYLRFCSMLPCRDRLVRQAQRVGGGGQQASSLVAVRAARAISLQHG